jgi:hypothetical protein
MPDFSLAPFFPSSSSITYYLPPYYSYSHSNITIHSSYLGVLGMNFDFVVYFYIIKGSFSAVFAVTLIIIIIGTPAYIYYLEESGALPRMLEHRPNYNKIISEKRVLKNVTSKNTVLKNGIIKNNCPPREDFKGADVMGISSMI